MRLVSKIQRKKNVTERREHKVNGGRYFLCLIYHFYVLVYIEVYMLTVENPKENICLYFAQVTKF